VDDSFTTLMDSVVLEESEPGLSTVDAAVSGRRALLARFDGGLATDERRVS